MKPIDDIKNIFLSHGGIMRTCGLRDEHIYYADIQKLLTGGVIEQLRRGYYYLTDSENTSEANIIVCLFPDAILCLETALFYHGYSDRTPRFWHLAVNKDTQKQRFRIDYPFVKPYYLEPDNLEVGLMQGQIDGVAVKIYDKERTICDCLKRSGKMDKEIFNKAIQSYVKDSSKNIPNLMRYAKELRVEKKVKDLIGVWL